MTCTTYTRDERHVENVRLRERVCLTLALVCVSEEVRLCEYRRQTQFHFALPGTFPHSSSIRGALIVESQQQSVHIMAEEHSKSSQRVLDPLERSSEVLFGLIMVLTFTSSVSAAHAGRAEIRTMIFGALGCNLAWGIIDAIMYLMASLSEKGHRWAKLHEIHSAKTPEAAYEIIRGDMPKMVAEVMLTEHLEAIRQGLLRLPHIHRYARITSKDWRGATGVFTLVFLTTLPVILPFWFTEHVTRALRISNLLAIVMLALTGYSYGYYSQQKAWVWSLSMVVLGLGMVGVAKVLGG